MPKARLDHAFCLTARCGDGKKKTDFYDETVTGFVLECRATGGKTYYLRYQDTFGKQQQHKIGRYEDITFAQAKRAAQKYRSEVVLGENPAAKKAAAKAVPTYAELAAMHMSDAKLHLKSYPLMEAMMRNHIARKWGRVRLTDIDSRAVAQWLADKRAAGLSAATVEKIRVTFGRSFELGAKWNVPGAEKNPTRGVPRKPLNNGRERFLSAEEAARLREAVSVSKNKQLPAIVNLLLLTGARVGELLRAEWRHVDLDGRRWTIPVSKNGHARHVPLSTAAVDVIRSIPKPAGAVYLFPNPADPKKHLTTIKHSWRTAREQAGLSDLRVHDMRHSFASFCVNSGVDIYTVGKILGHRSYQSTQRYSHLANDTLIAAVEAGAAKQI